MTTSSAARKRDAIRDKVSIVGVGCCQFGENWDQSPADMIVDAAYEAYADAGILRLILIESGIQTALAVAVGTISSIPVMRYLQNTGLDLQSLAGVSVAGIAMDPLWRAVIKVDVFATPVVILVIVVVLAVLYPAVKAAAIRPVEAMHHH